MKSEELNGVALNNIYHMHCKDGLTLLPTRSVGLVCTSPPYYNARDYSIWETLDDYLLEMTEIFTEVYRVLDNHRYCIVNVADIIGQTGKQKYTTKKIALGAYFTVMLEEIGFHFMDDFIWDKGEPQSKRHVGNPPYPFYQNPVNCYEHILIFAKHEYDTERIPCPVCQETKIQNNGKQTQGVLTWECKNLTCSEKSKGGRGKRFSKGSIMMNNLKKEENKIDDELIKKWRRDIVKINPVVKINAKGENKIGHTAPYPEDIPEMAIRFFTGVGDLVVDIFNGSGTTCRVAKRLGRTYLGYDIQKSYVELAKQSLLKEEYYA